MNERAMFMDGEYRKWLGELKSRIRIVQLKAAISVNEELLGFYWELGADIVRKQAATSWGDGFLRQLSADLMSEFPEMKGFSKRNLELIRQWYLFWISEPTITKQLVSQFHLVSNQSVKKSLVPDAIHQQAVGEFGPTACSANYMHSLGA